MQGCNAQPKTLQAPGRRLRLQPITLRQGYDFIQRHHRHHGSRKGWKFGIGAALAGRLVGVAMVGRPNSRIIQQREPQTCEVLRLCTDGARNACTLLYSACWRAARAMGYTRVITYILESEPGISLKAAGWRFVRMTDGGEWDWPTRPRRVADQACPKQLWEKREVSRA